MVKDYFDSSVGDILTVVKILHLSSSNQYREFQIKVAAEKIRKHVRFDAGDSFENEIQRVQTLAQAGGNAANSLSAQLRSIGNPTGILNPATSRSKGRPRGAKNKNRRVPSSFEHVEGNSSGRRCKNCNGVGHNSRTCTQNQLMSFP